MGSKLKIKRIEPMSLGKIFGLFYAIIGLVAGLILGLFSATVGYSMGISGFAGVFGIGSIIMFPLIYGIMGFIMGVFMALVYNFVASQVGGVEIVTE